MGRSLPIRRVLLVTNRDEFVDPAVAAALETHGCKVDTVLHPELGPGASVGDIRAYDLVLCCGSPHGTSVLPVVDWIAEVPAEAKRPVFAWWLIENLPGRIFPQWAVDGGARLRIQLDRQSRRHRLIARLLRLPVLNHFNFKGHYLRILGELYEVRRKGLLDVLPVGGEAKARYLQGLGFDAFPLFLGYETTFGRPLGLHRDIDVLFLGGLEPRRRRTIVRRIESELASRGIRLTIHSYADGWLGGDQRNQVLNRSKILLNVLRAPHHGVAYRVLLGAGSKSLVVSEPLGNLSGFVPGRHFVEAPIERLAHTVEYYLRHHGERQELCESAYRHAREEMTMERAVGALLERCSRVAHMRDRIGATEEN